MDDIVLTRTLRSQGFDGRDLGRMRRNGSLLSVRRGAYVRDRPAERTRAEEHRELILATVPQLHDGAVISHASAAVLHGLPTWPNAMDRVHVTRNRSSGGNRRSVVQVHTAPLVHDHVTAIDGLSVTSRHARCSTFVVLCLSNRPWRPVSGRWPTGWCGRFLTTSLRIWPGGRGLDRQGVRVLRAFGRSSS